MQTDGDKPMTTTCADLRAGLWMLRSLPGGALLLTLFGSSCTSDPLLPPDLGLACTMTGATACKPDAAPFQTDAMPNPSDARMPSADGMTGTMGCSLDTDCTSSCKMSALGCACVSLMMGGSKQCVPRCNTTADCPKPPMGTATCDVTRGVCLVMR